MILTILTPTYNRAGTLKKAYESLCEQINKNFQWLIIDDGSRDDTEQLAKSFISDEILTIEYYKKENGGKHTALNYSHQYIKGEWVLILDSDDWLLPNAVEDVFEYIKKYDKNKKIGILSLRRGYDVDFVIGPNEEKTEFQSNYIDYRINKNIQGDQCEVIRAEVFKSIIFPEYKYERFVGEDYLWINAAKKYDTVYINKIIYICEYLENGLTRSGRKMRIKNPLGGMLHGSLYWSKEFKFKYRIKGMILFLVYSFFAKKNTLTLFLNSNNKILFFMLLPGAYLIHLYWKYKYE